MKNRDILYLADSGVTHITAHSLSPEASYKVYRFKRALKKLRQEIIDQNAEFLEELRIDDPRSFDKLRTELYGMAKRTEEQEKELAELNEKANRFFGMRNEMLEYSVVLEGFGKLSYEDWKKLQDENKVGDLDPLTGDAEELLEGVLWEAPSW